MALKPANTGEPSAAARRLCLKRREGELEKYGSEPPAPRSWIEHRASLLWELASRPRISRTVDPTVPICQTTLALPRFIWPQLTGGTTVAMKTPVLSLHDSTTPSHQPFPLLHRIVRALGSKTKSATMQSVPTMLIAAAAQGAPIAADKAPMSMPPRSNNT